MTLAWHIARKDLRLQRLLLMAVLCLSALIRASRLIGPPAWWDPRWQTTMSLWGLLGIFGYGLLWLVCIASMIQSDRLVGSTAFWMTRPIAASQLLAGKLLGLFLFVVVPSLIFEAISMAMFRISPGVIVAALLQQAWTLAISVLVIVFVAAVTSTVVRLLLVVAVVLTIELVWIQIMVAIVRRRWAATGGAGMVAISLPFGYMDPNALILGGTTLAIGVLIAVAYQYRHRRRWPAIGLFVASFVAIWLLQGVWAHVPLIRPPSVEQQPWARDLRPRLRTVDIGSGRPLTADTGVIHLDDRLTVITAPVILDGLPPGYVATPYLQHAELTFADRSRLESSIRDAPTREVAVNSRNERWATLMDLEENVRHLRGDQPATYTGTFDFVIERYTPIATLPAAVGATASDGARSVTVSATRYETSGCTLHLATSAVTLVTHALEWPELDVRFHYRDGREMTDPYAPARQNRAFTIPRYAAGTASLLRPLALMTRPAFPMLRNAASRDGVQANCHDITMSVATVSYAGHLTRTLELHDFRLSDPFSAR